MLDKTITVEKLIDFALLQLWYVDYWKKQYNVNPDVIHEQVKGFEMRAISIISFLAQEVLGSSAYVEYKSIHIPKHYLPLFKDRENKYQHPEKDY